MDKAYNISFVFSETAINLNDIIKNVLKKNLKENLQMICNSKKKDVICNHRGLLSKSKEDSN